MSSLICRQHQYRNFANSSFINEVLQQVKKEIEENKELKKSIEEITQNELNKRAWEDVRNKYEEYARIGREIHREYSEKKKKIYANRLFQTSIKTVKEVFKVIQQLANLLKISLDHVSEAFHDDTKAKVEEKLQSWKEQRLNSINSESEVDDLGVETETQTNKFCDTETFDLVLRGQTLWERYGTKMQDMPFLSHFFEYGAIQKLFGETPQAAAIRESQLLDPLFELADLVDLVEHIICPHILKSFLKGDGKALKLHCGEALNSVMSQSVRERRYTQVEMDSTILIIRNIEFKSAACVEDSTPWFIFTFNAQHINCMRHKPTNKIVAGSPTDIREVMYSMAVRKHPDINNLALEYPWQVMEFAMVENNESW